MAPRGTLILMRSDTSFWLDTPPTRTNPIAFLWYASTPHRAWMIASISLVVIADSISAFFPYTFKMIVDAVTNMPEHGTTPLAWAAITYISVLIVRDLVWRASGFTGSYWAGGVRATARQALTEYVTLHSRDYFSNRFAGSLASKITHAANGIRNMTTSMLWNVLEFIVSVIASVIVAYFVHPVFALAFLGWAAVIIPFNLLYSRRRVPLAAAAQKSETALTGITVDLLANISAMQEYARRPYEMQHLKTAILARHEAGLRNWHFGENQLMTNSFIQQLFAALMVFVAIYWAGHDAFTAGNIVLLITMIYRMEDKFQGIGQQMGEISETWGEVEESLQEILVPHEIVDRPGARTLKMSTGSIHFDHATFAYAGSETPVLSEFELKIPAHQKVGLVGKSGAGKSTLIKLLLRHYELTRGSIGIDDVDISSVTLESLRSAIAVVPQESVLFHRTLRENIAYGKPDATQDEIEHAAKMAHAHEFIARLPEGYNTLVGERGVKLSGGERQRIAIARAILKDAPILVLDEATASLDSESEVRIQEALHGLMQGKTVIAIAHRLSTLREMDRIIVIGDGAIVEEGTHAQLLARKDGIYAELWQHQAGGFIADEK